MELRPGGGFIGSFGILFLKDLTFEDIKIYDVYDADGQLKAHIDPPDAIRKYLDQPHWFLRDSNFSPGFYENYKVAKFFLEKELQMSGFTGGVLITTSTIRNILQAFGNLYLSDFNEVVNKDNFYLKAQLYAEKNFFPGSTQKKSFLSALARQIIINLENVSPKKLLPQIFQSFEEKQLVAYFESQELENLINSFYWSGQIIEPKCPPQVIDNCYTDYIFPYDANLGVNKANFYINRQMTIKINFDLDGSITSNFNIKFKNNSLNDVFPGGNYRNYFQLMIPKDSSIKSLDINDKPKADYDLSVEEFKKIGFLFETPPQLTNEITLQHLSLIKFKKGRAIYQLLVQKQIGSSNNDLSLEINLPNNMSIAGLNFSPLVKNNQILYNTDLSTDKIFYIELIKQ